MKARFPRLSPGNTGRLVGTITFAACILRITRDLRTIGSGRTVTLKGFITYTTPDNTAAPLELLIAYPVLNAVIGIALGFLLAWLYNLLTQPPESIATGRSQL